MSSVVVEQMHEKKCYEIIIICYYLICCSLIIAAPDVDAWSIVKEVLPFLSFSAPFVIYHQYLQVISYSNLFLLIFF